MSGLKSALAGLREDRTPKRSDASPPKPKPAPGTVIARGEDVGKSRHPEYERVTVYVRKDTRKTAWRRWEDAEMGDFSDLVQMLLEQYLNT